MKKVFVQRGIYFITILLYVFLWIANENYKTLLSKSSTGLGYWVIDCIIITPLLFQLLFNNKLVWSIILSLLLIHMSWSIINIYQSLDFAPTDFVILLLLYLIPFPIMHYLYPKKVQAH